MLASSFVLVSFPTLFLPFGSATSEHPRSGATQAAGVVCAIFAGLSADRRKVVDELLVPYYAFANELEMAENALWVKHSSLTAVQV